MEPQSPTEEPNVHRHIGSAVTSQNRINRLLAIVETGQTAQMRLEAGERLAEICAMRPDTLSPVSHQLLSVLCRMSKPGAPKAPVPSGWEIREAAAAALGHLAPLWLRTTTEDADSNHLHSDTHPENDRQVTRALNGEHGHGVETDGWQAELERYCTSFDLIAILKSGTKLVSSAGTEFEIDEKDSSFAANGKSRLLAATRAEIQKATGGGLGIGISGTLSLPSDWLAEDDIAVSTPTKMRRKEQPFKVPTLHSIYDAICFLARFQLHHDRWTVRHGAVLGLTALVPHISAASDNKIVELVAFRLLHLIAIESFNDFVGERTIAPVREAAATLLATILIQHPQPTILDGILLLAQPSIPWNARHASFLVAKTLAICQMADCDDRIISMLSSAIANAGEDDEDISLVAMEALLALASPTISPIILERSPSSAPHTGTLLSSPLPTTSAAELLPTDALIQSLMNRLLGDTESLSPSTAVAMQLLAALLQQSGAAEAIGSGLDILGSRLLCFLRYPSRSVRHAALQTLAALPRCKHNKGVGHQLDSSDDNVLRALFHSMLLEDDGELRVLTERLWNDLVPGRPSSPALVAECRKLLLHHPLQPYSRDAFPWASPSSDLGFNQADLATLSILSSEDEVADGGETVLFPRLLNKFATARLLGTLVAGCLSEQELLALFPLGGEDTGAYRAMAASWVVGHALQSGSKELCIYLYERILLPLSSDAVVFWEEERDLITAIQRHLKSDATDILSLLRATEDTNVSAVVTLAASLRTLHEQLRLQTWAVMATLFVKLLAPALQMSFALNSILRPIVTWLRAEDGSIAKLLSMAPVKQAAAEALVNVIRMLLTTHCFSVKDPDTAARKALANVVAVDAGVVERETEEPVSIKANTKQPSAANVALEKHLGAAEGDENRMDGAEEMRRLPVSLARCVHLIQALMGVEAADEQWSTWVRLVILPPDLSPVRRAQIAWLAVAAAKFRRRSMCLRFHYNGNISTSDSYHVEGNSDVDQEGQPQHEPAEVVVEVGGIEVLHLPSELPIFDMGAKPSELLGRWCARMLAVAVWHPPSLPAALCSDGRDTHRISVKKISSNINEMAVQKSDGISALNNSADTLAAALLGHGPLSLLRGMSECDVSKELICARLNAIYEIFCSRPDSRCAKYLPLLAPHLIPLTSASAESIRVAASRCFAVVVQGTSLMLASSAPGCLPTALRERQSSALQMLDALFRPSAIPAFELKLRFEEDGSFELRPYQREGISWLAFLARTGLHGILADDMGLGKTIQMLAVMAAGADGALPGNGPSLVVAPPSLMLHWKGECERLTGTYLQPLVYHGADRRKLLSTLISSSAPAAPYPSSSGGTRESKSEKMMLVVTSYDVIRADIAELESIRWRWVVLDEGHAIRNRRSKTALAVKRLRGAHRIILSGTPIQNNLADLWSLFDFIMPGYLGQSFAQFMAQHGGRYVAAAASGAARRAVLRRSAEALERLHRVTNPFMLRRMKDDVLSDLPPKIISDIFVEMMADQRQLYESILNRGEEAHPFAILRSLLRCCTVPGLIDAQVASSPKLAALRDLLLSCGIIASEEEATEAFETGCTSRAIVIFQSLQTLEWVEQQLFVKSSIAFLRLDGSVAARDRQTVVDEFNGDNSIGVLLMTIGVGGEGLTLTGADTVIFMESDWNPSRDLQAMDRVHRLGQQRTVMVYRILTRGTIEERVMSLQRFKLHVASSVITQQNASTSTMDSGRLVELLALERTH